jgi:parallel beta-helix repeat protein
VIKNILVYSNSILLFASTQAKIDHVVVSNSGYGIEIMGSPYTTIINSEMKNNSTGLYIVSSDHIMMKNNLLHDNQINLNIYPSEFTGELGNDIDTTNIIEGKPIYYFENINDRVFDSLSNPSQFYCINCSNITLSNTTFDGARNKYQIILYNTTGSTIASSTIKNAMDFGIYTTYSPNMTLLNNKIMNNGVGVEMYGSPNSIFKNNVFSGNQYVGIELSSNNTDVLIQNNDFEGSWWAIVNSNNNAKIIQNNFFGSGRDLDSYEVIPILSESLPIGGNYYANYDTNEEGCFDADNNGVCDSPHNLLKTAGYNDIIIATDPLPWKTPNGWEKYTPPVTGYSNVLFLPGLEASRLYVQTPEKCPLNCEDQLWEPNVNSDVEDLYLNTDGTSKNPDIYTRDIIKEANTPVSLGALGQNIYKSFSEMMDKLVSDQKIAEWKAFPYDWRMSVEDVVEKPVNIGGGQISDLISTLKVLIKSSKNGKVTIIAHSNGGLVAKALLVKLQEMKNIKASDDMIDHIDLLILVASPQIGTASALPAMLHGYDQSIAGGWLMDEMRARELGRNMGGAYGLLPSKEYLDMVPASPVAFTDNPISSGITTPFVNAYGNVIDSYPEYKNFLFGEEGRTQPPVGSKLLPITLSSILFNQAENLHNKIDVWTPLAGLRVVEVAGWGLDTVASFQYYPKYSCTSPNLGTGTCGYVLDEKPIFTVDGDKTVVEPSALYGAGEKVWVDLKRYNGQLFGGFLFNREHKDILEVSQLNDFIYSLISKEDITYNSVLTAIKPIDNTNRLRISVHSPVSIGAYDKNVNANFTGKICPPDSDFCYKQEGIPSSSYMEFGEGKYLNLPENSLQKVVFQGTDIGTFTYESIKVTPDGQNITTTFVDIPVTTQTKAEVTLDATTQEPQLTLDVTGDGKVDFTITPKSEFDPILFLQIMRKTVESFDISKQQKNTLLNRIDDTIKAIQKGKINKAKLKIEQFRKTLTIHPNESEKDKQERERKNEREHEKELKEKRQPKQLAPADVQTLLTMLNQLLDNLNK